MKRLRDELAGYDPFFDHRAQRGGGGEHDGAVSRILFASHPFDGHFNPLTRLAVHLKARGHDVRWYTGSIYAERLARLGIAHYPFVRAKEITADNLTEHFPEYDTKPMDGKTACQFFFAPIEQNYRDLCDITRAGFRLTPSSAMRRCTCHASSRKSYPPRCTWSASAHAGSHVAHRPRTLFWLQTRSQRFGPIARRRGDMAARKHDETRRRDVQRVAPARRARTYAGSLFDMHVEKSRAIFQVGVPGLDFPRDDWPANFRFIGALLPEPRAAVLSPALEAKLTRYPSAILVSQGTTDNRDPDKLFVPSLEALAGSQHLVIITTGGRHTEALRQRFAQDNVVIEDWVDFHALLPRTSLFICNGGYGSVLLALSYGVPLLCAGKLEGKADINARLDYRGLAVDLRTERPTKQQIAKGVARVLGDACYAERVRELQMELRRYRPCEIIEQKLTADGILAA